MKMSEIPLRFRQQGLDYYSEQCQCQFCGKLIYFWHYANWITKEKCAVLNADNDSDHNCRQTLWHSFRDGDIPEGWEYLKSDNDDDNACFIIKKYTTFLMPNLEETEG